MKGIIIEVCGWLGMLAIVTAYALTSFFIITPTSLIYLVLNLAGSAGIVANAYAHRNFPSVALNIVWILIASVSLARHFI